MDFTVLKESLASELKQYNQLAASRDPQEQEKAAAMKRALAALPDRERDVLEQYFVNRQGRYDGHLARLCTRYRMEKSSMDRLKHEALLKYCVCMMAFRMAQDRT